MYLGTVTCPLREIGDGPASAPMLRMLQVFVASYAWSEPCTASRQATYCDCPITGVLFEHVFEHVVNIEGVLSVEAAQLGLKLVLDDLGLGSDITTVKQRKTIQKGVYLAEAAGVDLGYYYNWYVMGPYSPALTRDYFALSEALESGDDESSEYELQGMVSKRLDQVRPLMEVPQDIDLRQAEWLELLASIHFLLTKRKLNREAMQQTLSESKRHVARYTDRAVELLETRGLLAA